MAGWRRIHRRLFASWEACLAVVLGVLILGLAIPRLYAAVMLLPGDAVVWEALSGMPVTVEALAAAADSRRSAGWLSGGEVETELGTILLRHARASGYRKPEGRASLEAAAIALRGGLAGSPANPFAWWRLARIEDLLDESPERFADALGMSYLTGGHEQLLYLPRLTLGFRNWEELDDETRRMSEMQIRRAWIEMPDRFFTFAVKRRATGIVEHALFSLPLDLQVFRNRLRLE
jgi:hypothetical protein